MRQTKSIFSFAFLLALSVLHFETTASSMARPPHIDLEATSTEYRILLNQQSIRPLSGKAKAKDPVDKAIELGNRNLDWLKKINQKKISRGEQPISFSSPTTATGYPMTQPKSYGPKIIESRLEQALLQMPMAFRQILESTKSLPDEPSLPLADYIKWANEVDVIYQTSTRWKLMMPWKDYYTQAKANDIRGYYFLNQETDIEKKLKNFLQLSSADKSRFQDYLIMMCQNTEGVENDPCAFDLSTAIFNNNVDRYYQKYLKGSEKLWNDFFELQNPRTDISWSSKTPNETVIPFLDPKDKVVENFLRDNIQDEWKFLNWQLILGFSNTARINVSFEPDVTPHVNDLGGDNIVMNANTPLTEYDVQWTIRHEFGHTLGFTDCYIEFYDPKEDVMTSYQIDINNLMCSRKGHIQKTHYDQMKKYYYK